MRRYVDVASWQLASEFVRAFPQLRIFHTHPGGGQYDVLAIRALYWSVIKLWAQVPGIGSLTTGPTFPERPSLDEFKISMGARRLDLPVITGMRPPLRWYLRARKPHSLDRLLGRPVRARAS